jgi:hypothetical protein
MRLGTAALAVVLGCGCSAQLLGGADPTVGGVTTPDASPAPTSDAAVTPLCTSRSVYLNFNGQTLTRGPSDATLDQASWMTIAQGRAPAYRINDTNRTGLIAAITDGVRTQLSQFPITVTTSRPPPGTSYVMIVLGGVPSDVGSNFGGGVNTLDCNDTRPNDLAWISDNVAAPQGVINTVIGAIGFGLGLTATSDPKDCMCSWTNDCRRDNSVACQLGSPIDRDTTTARQLCPDRGPQDEVAAFRTAFCH